MTLKWCKYGFVLLAGASVPSLQAFAAASANDATLEEIVVTAQKRTENVQDVPVAITVVSGEQLIRQGVSSVSDLARSSASIEFGAPGTSSPGGGGYVRGIGTNSFGYSAQASVGLVLDGVVMGNANILSLFDIDRVEILKGPQGTQFGNSVSAGVINISTSAPDPSRREFKVSGEYGSDTLGSDYTRYSLRATVNEPLTANSAIRLSVHSEQNAGVFHNVWTNTDSSEPDNGFRLRYLFKPSDSFTLNLIADYNKATSDGHPALTYRAAVATRPIGLALADCGVTPGPGNFNFCSENSNVTADIVKGLSAQFDLKVGNDLTLTSITAQRNRSSGGRQDIMTIPKSITSVRMSASDPAGCNVDFSLGFPQFTNGCVPIYQILPGGTNGLQTRNASQFSEELRLASAQGGKVDWVAGVFFQGFKNEINEPGGAALGFVAGGIFLPDGKIATVKSTDYAGFANATVHFSDTVRGIAGLRYTHSNVKEDYTDLSIGPPNPQSASISVDANKLSYRAGVQVDFARHLMGYATISTGYKGPQISDDLANGNFYGVQPEVPTSYEVGFKASAFDNRLALDADVFYMDVKDYQGQKCYPNGRGTITCVPANVSSVKSKGVEVEIFGNPVRGLNLNLSAIYNPAEYPAGYLASDGSDLGGTQLTRSSKTKATFSGEYEAPVGGGLSLVLGADATYRAEQSIYPSASKTFVVGATTVYNARLGVRKGEDWGLYVFGRNLGDEHFPRDLFPAPFEFATTALWQAYDAGSRKIIGLQFDAKF